MANYTELKDIINNPTLHGLPAWNNDANQIEGVTMKGYLLTLIDSLTVGYQFMGVATPSTNPSTPDQKIFYLASQPGTYTNFLDSSSNAIVVNDGEVCALVFGTAWSKQVTGAATAEKVNQLGQERNNSVVVATPKNTTNGYFSTTDGKTIGGATDGISVACFDYISVRPGIELKFNNPDSYKIALYCFDENFELVSYEWFGTVSSYTVPSSVYYIRCAFRDTNGLVSSSVFASFYTDDYSQSIDFLNNIAQCYLYYGSNGAPVFQIKDDSSVDITFPNGAFRIYSRNGIDILGAVSSLNNLTVNVPSGKALVLNADKTYLVTSVNTEAQNKRYLLFSNSVANAFDGLLMPYYYQNRITYYGNSIDTYIYWQSSRRPTFSQSETTVTIKFPDANFHIFSQDGRYVVKGSSVGKNQTFTIPTNNSLVYNIAQNTIDVAALATSYPSGCYLLFSNVNGKYFSGLLMPYYFARAKEELGMSAYFAYGRSPRFAVSGTTITVQFPGSLLRIYSANNGKIIDIPASSAEFSVGSGKQLVYDLSDESVKVIDYTATGNYYELLTNNYTLVTGLLAPFYTQYQNSIPKLYDTQEEKLVFQNMHKRNVSGTSEAGLYPLVLLHFSDLHENTESLQRIMDYYGMYSSQIHDILHTGDTINKYENGYDTFTAVDGAGNILNCIGNHDIVTGHAGLDVYNLEFAPYIANWGVTQPTDAATLGLCYYYKDYSDANVRLIVLDNFATDMNAQVSWLETVLADAKTNGLCVVCAGHFPCPMDSLITQTPFCSYDGDALANTMQSDLISAVATFISGGGKFACWMTGHTHANLFGLVTDHHEQVCICVASASPSRNTDSMARVSGTKSQDCFNIISIDENTHCLKVHRVGADRDRYMRKVDGMAYNYNTKTLIM